MKSDGMKDSKRIPRLRVRMKSGGTTSRVPIAIEKGDPVSGAALFRSVYDGILLANRDGFIQDANPRAGVLLHRRPESLRGLNVSEVIAGANTALLESLLPAIETGRFALIEAYAMRSKRDTFPAEIAVSTLHADPLVLCFFIRDISRRRQAEELLRTGYTALQNASNGISVLGPDSCLRYVNTAFCRLWKADKEASLLSRRFDELVADSAPVRIMLDRTVSRHGEWRGEMTARRLDGTSFPAFVAAAANRDTDGSWTGAVVSITDITDAKRAEEIQREAERKNAMLASLGAACHHLAQPATVILGNMGVLGQFSEAVPEEIRMLIDSCAEAAEQLARVLHKLNTTQHYKTVTYLEGSVAADRPDNQVLDI